MAFAVFSGTLLVLWLVIFSIHRIMAVIEKERAVKSIADRPVRSLQMVSDPKKYDRTVQTWIVPPNEKLLSPISWLKYTENCIFSGRLNAMKFSGMIPGSWDIPEFIKHLGGIDFVKQWGLHTGSVPLTGRILNEINVKINGSSGDTYSWYSIKNMDELVYLVKKGHHVFIYTQVWMGPSKKYPKAVLYNNLTFAHACTVTGIKSYDPVEDVFEFEIHETLPFSMLTLTPVYSKVTKNGCNLFDRQSIPFIIEGGEYSRSGYIIKDIKKDMKQL